MSEDLSSLLQSISDNSGNRKPRVPASQEDAQQSPKLPAPRQAAPSAPTAPVNAQTAPVAPPAPRQAVNPAAAPVRPPEEPMEIEIETNSDNKPTKVPHIDTMLIWMLEHGGSDLFLSSDMPPTTKIHGEGVQIPGFDPLSGKDIESTVYAIINDKQRKKFEETRELDTSYSIPGKSRFRVNVFRSKGSVAAVLRTIPFEIKPIEALGLPSSLNGYTKLPRGLVLVTGPTGSGKSTTLAAMIDQINRTQNGKHILTIEDPIEFVHGHKGCVVNQREVGTDTDSFNNALKAALREAPDYILVGELRDYETISLAITMAETGHLVFGTLHTNSAPETISRIVDVFPADQQDQVKTQLAASLQAVVCQNLIRTKDGNGRVAAVEIMNMTQSIKSAIKKGRLDSIVSDMQTGSNMGMQTMDSHLERLVREDIISLETAIDKAHRPRDMQDNFGGEEEVNRIIQGGNRRRR